MCASTDEFVASFEATALPRDQWTHEAHVRVAWWYARTRPFPESLDAMRAGILRYNEVIGVETTADSGYHETVTVAWIRIMHDLVRGRATEESFDDFCASNPDVMDKRILLRNYTSQRLMSPDARAAFMEPDLSPLPSS